MLKLLIPIAGVLAAVASHAQEAVNFDPPTVAPSFQAVETKEVIVLDGKLIEHAWSTAPVVKDFFRTEPRQGGSYRYKTYVQVLYDNRNLYFGVFCQDSVGSKRIRVQDYGRDFNYSAPSSMHGFLLNIWSFEVSSLETSFLIY
jgi:hypothetical protein